MGTKFSTIEDVMYAVDDQFAAHPSVFCLHDLKKLEQQSKKCAELRKEYVE
jgi:hypothetical protein